jgi:phage N-6-adenine-methyltransferase
MPGFEIMSNDNYITPSEIYDQLNDEFNFNDDACPLEPNGIDGLLREWGSVTFMNPPYSGPTLWCMKAVQEMEAGKTVVGLLKADTSTRWFHEWVYPYAELRFIKGRVGFIIPGSGRITRTPFASMIAIWRKKEQVDLNTSNNDTTQVRKGVMD